MGEFLKTIRTISQQSIGNEAFEDSSHAMSSEPYFHDTGYKDPALEEVTVIDRKSRSLVTEVKSIVDNNEYSLVGTVIAVDKHGQCYMELEDLQLSSKTWKCCLTCKKFCGKDRQSIMDLKSVFVDKSLEEVRDLLQNLDNGCEHGHYSKHCDVDMTGGSNESSFNNCKQLKGHPLPCSSDTCNSRLRILRAGAVHHPVLRTLLNNIYHARRSDSDIRKVESCLSEGCIHALINNLKLKDLSELLDDEEESLSTIEVKPLSTCGSHLEVDFAGIIEEFHD